VSDGADTEPEPSPVRRALDIFVFAPVGVALTVAEDLPALIVKGRQRFESDVRNARIVGQFVVSHGQRDVVGRVSKLLHGEPVPSAEQQAARPAAPAAAAAAEPASESPADAWPTPAPWQEAAPPQPAADPADAVTVDAALAGYDTLSASQVVRRLESLEPDVLRAVQRHESSHRNRRTILNRAQQLLEGAGPDRPAG
jgi:hypothetical protein